MQLSGCREELGHKLFILMLGGGALAYGFQLFYEVHQRREKEEAVSSRWLSDCEAVHEPSACDSALDTLEDYCLKESRTSRNGISFRPMVFFECMNERNTAGVDVDVPDPGQ